MIARKALSSEFVAWNRHWGAPFGRDPWWRDRLPRSGRRTLAAMRALGPFAFQRNNTTRAFEYPWAFFAVGPEPGLRVLEIGGGLSGLQFVLSACGARVVNVDPGEVSTGKGWSLDPDQFDRLNRAFRSEVELRKCTLDAAHLPDAGFDRVVSISALEHVSERELPILMKEIGRVLRPGGLLVLTVDLFLDLAPFSDRLENRYGRNLSIPYIVAASQLELAAGERSELNGFVEFEPRTILAKLPELLYGAGWPAVTQALVLRKAA